MTLNNSSPVIYLGAETEYGIATPENPTLSPIVTSTHAIVAFGLGEQCARGARWDYASEHPLRDLRGFDLRRYHDAPVVDPQAIGMANTVLTNGGRFYVDHAHPEYSSPETSDAFQAALYDAAGDLILMRAAALVAEHTAAGHSVLEHHEPCPPLKLYKNNVDGKGASYGSHENYRYPRSLNFDVLAQALIPFFVCRQVLVGAGRIGIGQFGEQPGFQISQRADYIEQEISLETTLNRGIINTRDEPHADAEHWGRLHVIIGDANMSHTANVLKFGLTSLVIRAVIRGEHFTDLRLKDAVPAVQQVSRDVELQTELELANGSSMSALAILKEYAARLQPESAEDERVLELFTQAVDALAQGPLGAAHLLDWCAKYRLIHSYLQRGVAIDAPTMALLDLQYSDIDPAKGLYHALVRKGQMQTLFSEQELEVAAATPPEDSRAYLRGELIKHHHEEVRAASWESVTVADGDQLYRIWLHDLDGCTAEEVRDIVSLPMPEMLRRLGSVTTVDNVTRA